MSNSARKLFRTILERHSLRRDAANELPGCEIIGRGVDHRVYIETARPDRVFKKPRDKSEVMLALAGWVIADFTGGENGLGKTLKLFARLGKDAEQKLQETRRNTDYILGLISSGKIDSLLFAHPTVEDGTMYQRRVELLRERLHKLGDSPEAFAIIDKFIALKKLLLRHGLADGSNEYTTNYGLLDDHVVAIDLPQFWPNKGTALRHARNKSWTGEKAVQDDKIHPAVTKYYCEQLDLIATDYIEDIWGTQLAM